MLHQCSYGRNRAVPEFENAPTWEPFLNRAVNKRGGVNGETGEFARLREAYSLNQPWLRAHPGLSPFEPEKPPVAQIPRNVWVTGTLETGGGVNYNSERKLAKRE